MRIIHAVIVRSQKKIEKAVKIYSYLKTCRFLNYAQRWAFYMAILQGKIDDELVIKGGKAYSDKTFFVIRRDGIRAGLFSLYITTIGWINYALEKGYIPVVDMSIYRNNYVNKKKRGVDNAWEYYFDQPLGYGIKEAYSAENLILSSMKLTDDRPNQSMLFFNNTDGAADKWKRIVDKYVHINRIVLHDILEEYTKLLGNKRRVLGVLARGTDYNRLKPSKHPIMPEIDELISDTSKMLNEYGCDGIFLATEDVFIMKAFREHFGELIITNNREYIDYKDGYICQKHNARDNDEYLSGKEYLATIWMLSRSAYILCGRTSGAVAAVLMADKGFDHSKFYDLGEYK